MVFVIVDSITKTHARRVGEDLCVCAFFAFYATPPPSFEKVVTSESFLTIGDEAADLGGSEEAKEELHAFLKMMRPWKKGPLRLFGVDIDTEWRSDWKVV